MTARVRQTQSGEARRALVLQDRSGVVDLIELTLNHGVFEVRGCRDLAEAEAAVAESRPRSSWPARS